MATSPGGTSSRSVDMYPTRITYTGGDVNVGASYAWRLRPHLGNRHWDS